MANVTDELRARARARLLAYIRPNAPSGDEQAAAFERAVDCQARFEAENADAFGAMSRGVSGFTVGGYSERYFDNRAGGEIPVCPEARDLLRNAGLIRRSWPTARRVD